MKIKYAYTRDYFGNHTILELNAEYVTFQFEDKECSLKDVFNLIGEMETRIAKLERGDD